MTKKRNAADLPLSTADRSVEQRRRVAGGRDRAPGPPGGVPPDWPAAPVTVAAPGKINLALRVGPRRDDSYHELATVFLALSITDEITAAPAEDSAITAHVTGEGADLVGEGWDNLAVRAADHLRHHCGRPDLGVALAIHKRLPVAGGMAGGSADAAGALVACSRLWGLTVSPEELSSLAAELGADVPFPLLGGCALGRGRGDQLTPVLVRGQFHWVLALAQTSLSTAAVFQRYDALQSTSAATPMPTPPATPEMPPALFTALAQGDPAALGAALVNDLTPAALSLAPQLRRTLEAGLEAGALGAVVSGSGPTVALLAADEAAAQRLMVRLSSEGVARALRLAHGPVPGVRLTD